MANRAASAANGSMRATDDTRRSFYSNARRDLFWVVPFALKAGLDPSTVDAIANRRRPAKMAPDEAVVPRSGLDGRGDRSAGAPARGATTRLATPRVAATRVAATRDAATRGAAPRCGSSASARLMAHPPRSRVP